MIVNEKNVTDEGTPSNLDLGQADLPGAEDIASLDQALDEAGVGLAEPPDSGDAAPPDATPAVAEVVAQPAATPPAEVAAPATTEEIDLDAVVAPEHISPSNRVNFDKLRDAAKKYREQAQRVPELEEQLRTKTMQPEVEKELHELREFRRIFDTERDPEFNRVFNEKVGAIDEEVLSLLRRNGLPEKVEQDLRASGITAVSSSWWEQHILPKLSFVDRERVQRKMAERADVLDQRSVELETFYGKREEYMQAEQHQKDEIRQREETEIYQHLDVLSKDVPWARYREIPSGATAEEVAALTKHNATVAELEQNFNLALNPKTPKDRAEIAAAAAAAVQLSNMFTSVAERLHVVEAEKQKIAAELQKIKQASRIPSTRSAPRRSDTTTTAMPDEDAIERALNEAEQDG